MEPDSSGQVLASSWATGGQTGIQKAGATDANGPNNEDHLVLAALWPTVCQLSCCNFMAAKMFLS
jgi:hypothetical protein